MNGIAVIALMSAGAILIVLSEVIIGNPTSLSHWAIGLTVLAACIELAGRFV